MKKILFYEKVCWTFSNSKKKSIFFNFFNKFFQDFFKFFNVEITLSKSITSLHSFERKKLGALAREKKRYD